MNQHDKIRCQWANSDPLLRDYHDTEYGFPLTDDNQLFERLVLEQMQAGLSWLIVLRKRQGFRTAFHQFDIATIANYTTDDIERLVLDASIIRNRKKIEAAIENARRLIDMQNNGRSFQQWIAANAVDQPSLDEWVKRFKKSFVFVGREIVNEFLMSIGILPIAHEPDCWLAKK